MSQDQLLRALYSKKLFEDCSKEWDLIKRYAGPASLKVFQSTEDYLVYFSSDPQDRVDDLHRAQKELTNLRRNVRELSPSLAQNTFNRSWELVRVEAPQVIHLMKKILRSLQSDLDQLR